VRRRIVMLTVAAATLAIALFGVPLAAAVFGYFLQDEQAALQRTAATVALRMAASGEPTALPPLDAIDVQQAAVGLYSAGGRLLAGAGPESLPAEDRRGGNAGEQVVVVQPMVRAGTTVAYVRVAASHRAAYWRIVLVWLAMSGLAVVAIGIAALLARRISARLTRPMEELSTAAEKLGAGDFSVRTGRSGIKEIDRVAETLDQAAADIAATVAKEREFAAHASHQLRTPVTGLRLELEAALENPHSDLRAAMSGALHTADRLQETITDLLELTGRRPGRGPATDLPELLEETRRAWHGPLAAQGRALRVVTDPVPPSGASAAAVRQIIGVLVDNAAEHGSGVVTITCREAAGAPALDVGDDGSGIAETVDPFSAMAPRGHGIGLPMARRLAEAEGARLFLSQAAPPVFTLLLPPS
jgi:signal transduction histidine kinase